ncbi:MAG TPA: PrsW family glutamic-type intramembrane protease [Ilumatobacter sp.]|nr:PrsW family glutamic-type intramembrane protease [Ilumatobacter sp.]
MSAPLAPPAPGGPPPAWYPDPLATGGWRWWDGHAWTPYVSNPGPGPTARKPRLPRWLSVPVVACAPLVILLLVILAASAPIAVVAAVVPLMIVWPTLAWLDRVEPEPTSSRVHAVLWGAFVAVLAGALANESVAAATNMTVAMVVSAPLVEEAFKVLGVVWAVRRGEVDGVTDGIVFAGWVALGFAVVEDVLYFADAGEMFPAVFLLRAILTPFAHPLFTFWAGLAIGWAVSRGRRLWPAALGGLAVSVALHAAWNGSLALAAPDPETGEGGSGVLILAVVGPLFVVLFVGVVIALVRMRRAEQRRFVAQWPFLVRQYGLTAAEQAWFVDWRQMLVARRSLPRPARRRFDAFRAALARLSMHHARLGTVDANRERVLAEQLATARRDLAAR